MLSVIYLMNWKNNDYFYVGQSSNFDRRKGKHIGSLKSGNHHNQKVQNVFNKYGEPQFHIIEECEPHKLNEREQFYLDLLFDEPACVNVMNKVGKWYSGKHTEKIKSKMRRPKTKEAKLKMREAKRGKMIAVLQMSLDNKLIATFESVREAARVTGICHSEISRCVQGKKAKTSGYIWRRAGV